MTLKILALAALVVTASSMAHATTFVCQMPSSPNSSDSASVVLDAEMTGLTVVSQTRSSSTAPDFAGPLQLDPSYRPIGRNQGSIRLLGQNSNGPYQVIFNARAIRLQPGGRVIYVQDFHRDGPEIRVFACTYR